MLKGKKILLGITGGIAAYKSAFLVRLLKKEGAEVQVVVTPEALDFVTPLTLSTLSGNPVYHSFTIDAEKGTWTNHVSLAGWADLMVIAPLTASTLAKMAYGVCDNLLMAVYLSMKSDTLVAPAMDLDMFKHPTTKTNLKKIAKNGVGIIPPGTGFLASGLSGEGRMEEPEQILEKIKEYFSASLPLKGVKILVSAGPTREPIDPVRYIGNESSGLMGYSMASVLAEMGAEVCLVSGPVSLPPPSGISEFVPAKTAREMEKALVKRFPSSRMLIMSAAVADYRPQNPKTTKIKKGKENTLPLTLVKNPDILSGLGKTKKKNQIVIGFALETEAGIENAAKKLKAKNANAIVLNFQVPEVSGAGSKKNRVWVLTGDNKIHKFKFQEKESLARELCHFFYEHYFIKK
jgi:phosphopantothenoylcysteine decarboxylase / phosphopantothenate---cysteine ligase